MNLVASEEKQPKVSVVIAVKNEERTIANAIESALKLDYPSYEVILIDNGSKDRTVSIAKQKCVKIIQRGDSTSGEGRNAGIKHSSAKIVAFFDGDCYARKDWLKNAVALLRQDGVGGVGGPIISYSRGGYMSKTLLDVLSTFFANAGSTLFARYKRTKEVKNIGGVGVYRKEALERAGLYSKDLRFCEDVDLNYKIRAAGYSIIYSPNVLVEHDWKVHSFRSLFRHMFRYGHGRAIASRKYSYLFSPFYAIPSIALVCVLLLLILSFTFGGIFMFVTQLSLSGYGILALLSASLAAHQFRDVRMVVIAPVAYVITHAGYAIGFIYGLFKRRI